MSPDIPCMYKPDKFCDCSRWYQINKDDLVRRTGDRALRNALSRYGGIDRVNVDDLASLLLNYQNDFCTHFSSATETYELTSKQVKAIIARIAGERAHWLLAKDNPVDIGCNMLREEAQVLREKSK